MKVLVEFDEKFYLVPKEDINDYLFSEVNKGRWPSECWPRDEIQKYTKIIAYFNDEAELENDNV
jgi:hypothetical protein